MFFRFDAGHEDRQLAELDEWRLRMDEGRPMPRRWASRLRRDLEAEAVAASTRMEGVPVTVDDVRQILAGDPPRNVPQSATELVLGYRNAMTFVLRRADDPHFEWNRELLVGIHDRVLAGRAEDGAGRLRVGETRVANRDTGEVVFAPPQEEVAELVDRLCAEFVALETHPAIAAAWFHVTFAAIHPFRDGNGRTARVLSSLVMYRGGFRTPTFTSLEEWWGRHPDDYYRAFACLGSRFDPSADVTPFISAHLTAQLQQIRALDLRERTQRGLWIMLENVLVDSGLHERITNALWEAFFGRPVRAGYYRGLVDVSAPTATSDLRAATAAGLLDAVGERRGRVYLPGTRLFRVLARELALNDPVGPPEAARAAIITELSSRLLRRGSQQTRLFDTAG
ncbi:MAG TPA: Fic family protein [Solirubrobacteraceae bacterium]|jgi:Fic family protein